MRTRKHGGHSAGVVHPDTSGSFLRTDSGLCFGSFQLGFAFQLLSLAFGIRAGLSDKVITKTPVKLSSVRTNRAKNPFCCITNCWKNTCRFATSLIKLDVENNVKFGESNLGICSTGYGVSLQNT